MCDFICQCGRRFEVSNFPGRYVCSTCQAVHYHRITVEQHQQRQVNKAVASARKVDRRKRIQESVDADKRLTSALRRRSQQAEGLGDACARFLDLALRYRSPLADRLHTMLYTCGCDRATAIANLNQQSNPQKS